MRAFLFRLLVWAAAGFTEGVTLSHSLHALYRLNWLPPKRRSTRKPRPPDTDFMSDAGIRLKFIKPDRTADFEATVDKLQEALARSSNPERRRQALSWRVFRAAETATNGDAVYV